MATTNPAAEAAFRDATERVGLAYALGAALDDINAREHDRSAWMLSEARTDDGKAYAAEYGRTADTLIADLRADETAATVTRPEAGTAHPDAAMAALGWHANQHGIYVRDGHAGAADVAALERYAGTLRGDMDREAG
jgi:hypothetical protein